MTTLSKSAWSSILVLMAVVAIRMLGLFLFIPILSPYLKTLVGQTPFLIGLTVGVYGLAQVCLQIPMGRLSDRFGRKRIVMVGLLLFGLGSYCASTAVSIIGLLTGRALQGAGAISGTMMAWVSDLSTEKDRTFVMALMGVTIGVAFLLAFILGPLLHVFLTVSDLFLGVFFSSILMVFGIVLGVPDRRVVIQPLNQAQHQHYQQPWFQSLSSDQRSLLVFYAVGVFILHAILTANFVVLPLWFEAASITMAEQARDYALSFLFAVVLMLPLLRYADRDQKMGVVLSLAMMLIIVAELLFSLSLGASDRSIRSMILWFGLCLFFTGFNLLEASLPSLVSKLAPIENRGVIMGAYSTAQFLGPALGGSLAGLLLTRAPQGLFILLAIVMMVGLILWVRCVVLKNRI